MLLIYYLSGAATLGTFWLVAFLRDRSIPKTHVMSWVVFLIAVLLWPLTFPLSCLELLTKPQRSHEDETLFSNTEAPQSPD